MEIRQDVPNDRAEFTIQRVFDGPRELVYKIWTNPTFVQQWWGIKGSSIPVCEMDVRPGGMFRIDMKLPDGSVYVNRGMYTDVIPSERIVTKDIRNAESLEAHLPLGTYTVIFADFGVKTVVTLTARFETIPERDVMVHLGMVDGIEQSLETFAIVLARTRKQ